MDIKPNLCLYNKFSSKSNRFIMVSEGFGSLWDPRRREKVFLSVSYDIKHQEIARKHMATSRDKEQVKSRQQSMTSQEQAAVHNKSRAGSSAWQVNSKQQCRTTHFQQLAAATTQHSNIAQHTRSSTSTKTNSCQNKELSKHIHSVLLKWMQLFKIGYALSG